MEHIWDEAKQLQDKIVEWRRVLHRFPEIGLDLPRTAEFVKRQLTAAGVEYVARHAKRYYFVSQKVAVKSLGPYG